jgi:hypothetical protein
MADNNNFRALIGIAYDMKQAQSELDRQIKSLQKSSKLALKVELTDKEAKKVIQDSSKMWSNYRKEAVQAMTAPNTELQKMAQYYKNLEKEIQSQIASSKKLFLDQEQAYKTNQLLIEKEASTKRKLFLNEEQAYKINESLRQKAINDEKKLYNDTEQAYKTNNSINQKKISELNKVNNATIEAYKTNNKLNDSMEITKNRAEGANKSFSAYVKSLNPSAAKQYSTEIDKISKSFQTAQTSGKQIDLSKANSEMTAFKGKMKEAGLESKTFFGNLKDSVSKFSQWFLIGGVTAGFVRNIIDGIKFIGDLDAALTNINYTMDVSSSDLVNIGNSSIQMAKDLKTSASNILQAVTIYANANETAQSILNKSKPTIMLSNVTGMSASETADILQGTLEQFSLGENQLLHVSDVLEKVSQSMKDRKSVALSAIENISSSL